MTSKGIIVSPVIHAKSGKKKGIKSTLSPTGYFSSLNWSSDLGSENLRTYALYWDYIDYSYLVNSIMWPEKLENNKDLKLLQKEGIIKRNKIFFDKSKKAYINEDIPKNASVPSHRKMNDMMEMSLRAPFEILNFYASRKVEHWSVAQTGSGLAIPKDKGPVKETLSVDFSYILPSFSKETPMEEILDFKFKRSDELKRFRVKLDEYYEILASAHDIDRAHSKIKSEIVNAVIDIHKVVNEAPWEKVLSSFKAYVDPANMIEAVLAAGGGAGLVSKTIFPSGSDLDAILQGIGALAGLALPGIRTYRSKQRCVEDLQRPLRDYAYVYSVTEARGRPPSH